MDLSKLTIEPRLRQPWEAVDLGILLTQRWFWPMFWSWVIPATIVATICLLIFGSESYWPLLIIWWLKPLFDRGPLLFASRALFNEHIPLGTLLKQLPSAWARDILPWLTWRRLSPARSFVMPVTQLEGLKGKGREKRLSVLQRTDSSAGAWLTIAGVHIETVISMGLFALLVIMTPQQNDIGLTELLAIENNTYDLLSSFLTILAMALVAPFYSTAGFTLYISRRIELEAWDVEIRFRHLVEKQTQKSPTSSALLSLTGPLLLCAALTTTSLLPQPVLAAENINDPVYVDSQSDARALIDDIMSGDDFEGTKTVKRWRLKESNDDQEDEDLPSWLQWLLDKLESLFDANESNQSGDFSTLAKVLEVALWIAVACLLIFVLYRYRHAIKNFAHRSGEQEAPVSAEVLFGLDLRETSLPDDIPAEVRSLYEQQQFRQALSLLYRATLSKFIHQHQCVFSDSDTEGECLTIIQQQVGENLGQFAQQLTQRWQLQAYAHRETSAEVIAQLLTQWQELFTDEQ